MCAQSNVKFIF